MISGLVSHTHFALSMHIGGVRPRLRYLTRIVFFLLISSIVIGLLKQTMGSGLVFQNLALRGQLMRNITKSHLCLALVAFETSYNLKVKVHLKCLRETGPLLFVKSLGHVIRELLLAHDEGVLVVLVAQLAEVHEHLLTLDDELGLLMVDVSLRVSNDLLVRLVH